MTTKLSPETMKALRAKERTVLRQHVHAALVEHSGKTAANEAAIEALAWALSQDERARVSFEQLINDFARARADAVTQATKEVKRKKKS